MLLHVQEPEQFSRLREGMTQAVALSVHRGHISLIEGVCDGEQRSVILVTACALHVQRDLLMADSQYAPGQPVVSQCYARQSLKLA